MRPAPDDCFAIEPIADVQALLPLALASPQIGLATIDAHLRYRFVNETLALENGCPSKAHVGKTVRQILGSRADLLEPVLRDAFAAHKVMSFQLTAKSRLRPAIGKWMLQFAPMDAAACGSPMICALVLEITHSQVPENLEHCLFHLAGKLSYLSGILPANAHGAAWQEVLQECTADVLQALGTLRGTPPLLSPSSPIAVPPLPDARLRLSNRQREILQRVASNKSNKEIAVEFNISERTVEAHRRRVMERLGLHSVGELIHYAIRHRLIQVQ